MDKCNAQPRFVACSDSTLLLIDHDDYSPQFRAEQRLPMDAFLMPRDHLVHDDDLPVSERLPTKSAVTLAN